MRKTRHSYSYSLVPSTSQHCPTSPVYRAKHLADHYQSLMYGEARRVNIVVVLGIIVHGAIYISATLSEDSLEGEGFQNSQGWPLPFFPTGYVMFCRIASNCLLFCSTVL